MLEFYKEHKIRPVVDRVFKFEEGKDAIKYLFSGRHFGKVVVKVRK
jgi:NADPH:quinone reductase-like Zn-dependent oxidoreductase